MQNKFSANKNNFNRSYRNDFDEKDPESPRNGLIGDRAWHETDPSEHYNNVTETLQKNSKTFYARNKVLDVKKVCDEWFQNGHQKAEKRPLSPVFCENKFIANANSKKYKSIKSRYRYTQPYVKGLYREAEKKKEQIKKDLAMMEQEKWPYNISKEQVKIKQPKPLAQGQQMEPQNGSLLQKMDNMASYDSNLYSLKTSNQSNIRTQRKRNQNVFSRLEQDLEKRNYARRKLDQSQSKLKNGRIFSHSPKKTTKKLKAFSKKEQNRLERPNRQSDDLTGRQSWILIKSQSQQSFDDKEVKNESLENTIEQKQSTNNLQQAGGIGEFWAATRFGMK